MKKIKCHCGHSFSVERVSSVNLEKDSHIIKEIKEGSFLSYTCPACEFVLRMEFKVLCTFPSKNISLVLIPEPERIRCLHFCAQLEEGAAPDKAPYLKKGETPVIGYAELADRVQVIVCNLDPQAIEAVKFFLQESAPKSVSKKMRLFFSQLLPDKTLEFKAHGLKEKDVALLKIPFKTYTDTVAAIKASIKDDIYSSLFLGPYLSYRNIGSD